MFGWKSLKEAFADLFWAIIAAILIAIFSALGIGPDRFIGKLIGLFTTPLAATLVIARTIFFVLAAVLLLLLIVPRLRRPQFSVSFDARRDIIRNVPIFPVVQNSVGPVIYKQQNLATFVHLRVSSLRGTTVTTCSAAITLIEEIDKSGKVISQLEETRDLIWAPHENQETSVTLLPNKPRDLDIFRSIKFINTLDLMSIGHNQNWVTFFNHPGIYRITVVVTGNGKSKIKRLRIKWRRKWDDFDVEEIA